MSEPMDPTALPPGFVLDPHPADLPPGFTPDETPGHPIAPASGDWWDNTKRFVGTAAANAWQGITSPMAGGFGVSIDPENPRHPLHIGAPPTDAERADAVQQQRDAMFNMHGATEYQPTTTGGRMGMSALSAVLSGTPAQAIPSAVGGAVGEGAAELFPNHPVLSSTLGFILGQKAATKGLNTAGAVTGVVPPAGGSMPPEDAALAANAQARGIPLGVAQVSRDRGVKYADSVVKAMPFSGTGEFEATQRGAFTRAVSHTFGEDAEKLTPDVIDNAYHRIGGDFDRVAANTTIHHDAPLTSDLAALETRVADSAMAPEQKAAIQRQIDNVRDVSGRGNGAITGDQYQTLTARNSTLGSLQRNANPDVANFAGDLRESLDSALERHASPDDVATLQQARRQYKALKTVEPLTLRADTPGGATPSTGDISPAALRARVNQQYPNSARQGLGENDLNDLAKIGQRFLKEPGSSGSGERAGLIGAGLSAAAAIHEGVPWHAAIGAPVATWAAARALGAALRNQSMARSSIAASQNPNGWQFPATPNPLALQLLMPSPGNAGLLPAGQKTGETPQ